MVDTTRCIATVDEHKQTFEHYATKLQMATRWVDCDNDVQRCDAHEDIVESGKSEIDSVRIGEVRQDRN